MKKIDIYTIKTIIEIIMGKFSRLIESFVFPFENLERFAKLVFVGIVCYLFSMYCSHGQYFIRRYK